MPLSIGTQNAKNSTKVRTPHEYYGFKRYRPVTQLYELNVVATGIAIPHYPLTS